MHFGKICRAAFIGLGIVVATGNLPAHADGTTPPATTQSAPPKSAAARIKLERFHRHVFELSLTPEQKGKITPLFATALKEYAAADAIADPAELQKQVAAASEKVRSGVQALLTPEQTHDLVEKMKPKSFHDQLQGIKQKMLQLGLTDDQSKQLDLILGDAEKKIDDIQTAAQANNTDPKPEERKVNAEMQGKLMGLLTDAQKNQLKEKK